MAARRLLVLPLVLAALSGCATKKDLRELQTVIQGMRTSQEALIQELRQEVRRQNALLIDSMTVQDIRLRGDFANRLVALDRQLIQIQELTGQGQQRLEELRQDLRAQEAAMRAAQAREAELAASGAGGGGTPAGNPDELFTAAKGALDRGSFATGRAGFEEFVRAFPQHARAPEAQLYIGEAREKAGEARQALEAYQRVVELHPNSTQAPTALLRAALIEVAAGNRTQARTMLRQLTTAYPRSPEVTRARQQLERLQ